MLLELGKAFSELVPSRGRGIGPGCTRSNGMAKASTNRTLDKVRKKAAEEPGCDNNISAGSSGFGSKIHVDDVAMILWARMTLGRIVYHVPKLWAWLLQNDLRM